MSHSQLLYPEIDMKFFTTEWWQNSCENAEEVFDSYKEHLSKISSHIPDSLHNFMENHTLHDARVHRIETMPSETIIYFMGWNNNFENEVLYKLKFSGVTKFIQQLPTGDYIESELGDLGYWECDFVENHLQINMLFATEAEFQINFKEFNFTHENKV